MCAKLIAGGGDDGGGVRNDFLNSLHAIQAVAEYT